MQHLVGASTGGSNVGALVLIGLVIGALLALNVALQVLAKKKGAAGRDEGEGAGTEALRYERRAGLLSPAELNFFRALEMAAAEVGREGGGVRVMCKVRLGDLIRPAAGLGASTRLQNKVQQKHADFVVVDTEGMRVLAVVELDDASHRGKGAAARDAFKDAALKAAGVPVVRVEARRGYSVAGLTDELRGLGRDGKVKEEAEASP